jgi:hypothetical protein
MGEACMLRGEFARAWRHCLHARRLLKKRGVPECWWIAEAERVATLAVAAGLSPDVASFLRGSPTKVPLTDDERSRMNEVAPAQICYLESIFERAKRLSNEWRCAEIRSALGQLRMALDPHDSSDELQNGVKDLEAALAAAHRIGHRVLMGDILEAMSLPLALPALDGRSDTQRLSLLNEAQCIGEGFEHPYPNMRRNVNCALLALKCLTAESDKHNAGRLIDDATTYTDRAFAWGLRTDISSKGPAMKICNELQTELDKARQEFRRVYLQEPVSTQRQDGPRNRKWSRYPIQKRVSLRLSLKGKPDELTATGLSVNLSDQGVCCLFYANSDEAVFKGILLPLCEEIEAGRVLTPRRDFPCQVHLRVAEGREIELHLRRVFRLSRARWRSDEFYAKDGFSWGIAAEGRVGDNLPGLKAAFVCDGPVRS